MRSLSLAVLGLMLGVASLLAQTQSKPAPKPAAPAKAQAPAPSKAAQSITMPPIPNPGYAPGRPVDVTRAVYRFAAEHPEVLKFVPCYCGCESTGHGHNESCFVKRRDARGNVTEWDVHGYG